MLEAPVIHTFLLTEDNISEKFPHLKFDIIMARLAGDDAPDVANKQLLKKRIMTSCIKGPVHSIWWHLVVEVTD